MASYQRLNFTANGYLAPPLGFPMKLGQVSEYEARGEVPKSTASVTATVYADKQCDVHVALLCAPLVRSGSDSELLLQVDTLAVTRTLQSIAITTPTNLSAATITPAGTITIAAASQSVTGSGTAFPTDGQWNGYEIQTKNGSWYQVSSVTSATALTLVNPTTTISAGAGAFYVRRPTPAALVYRIWIDNIVGGTVETIARDAAITSISTQPQIPGGLNISSIVVA